VIAIDTRETEHLAAAVARIVPVALAPVFDAGSTRSHMLFDEYVFRLALQVFASAGLEAALGEWASVDEVVARRGLVPECGVVPVDWILRHLAARGVLARDGDGRFRVEHAVSLLDPAPVLAEQQGHDPACLPSYTLAATAAADYPAFLRGERSGEDILFAPARLPLWVGYFSNDNPLYAVNNRVGAVALESWMPPEATAILELGGGLGSGAAAALEHLAAVGRLGALRAYRFTELVPAFLRRGQRMLQQQRPDAAFLTFASLDMNRAFADQGVAPASVSVVYAVNTLHVAHDLAFTLGEIHRALEPDGHLIVSECIRPWPGQTAYPEFVFNLLKTFRAPRLHAGYRPNGGFLTPDQWAGALTTAGFVDVRVLPDIARIREILPTFYVAALGARRAA
jgi:SAM-dependent methyltransferase